LDLQEKIVMKDKWISQVCPFARDQGFDSVIGDVKPGETVFGFTHTMVAAHDHLNFAVETAVEKGTSGKGTKGQRIIHEMADIYYRVFASKISTDGGASEGAGTYEVTKAVNGFILYADIGMMYDVVVIGRVRW
jgi:hypothetical protein